ncbi:hypothetical protein Rleg10DRAFT_3579 [Rhizobium leguminosarum bv. trifolii WSM2012]|nr:hypothetical protein Rleg10DRAFT_3579 [Rhizobium leguminosarum bv. trifolii WSM2012]
MKPSKKKAHFVKRNKRWHGGKGDYARWGPDLKNVSRKSREAWPPGIFGNLLKGKQ